MPLGDGTGPAGLGPMTGRAAGYCAGYPVPGYMNPIAGRGYWGWGGRGGGWGRRNWFYATGLSGWQRAQYGYPTQGGLYPYGASVPPTVTKEQELEALKNQAGYFEETLGKIRKRIEELEAGEKKTEEKKE